MTARPCPCPACPDTAPRGWATCPLCTAQGCTGTTARCVSPAAVATARAALQRTHTLVHGPAASPSLVDCLRRLCPGGEIRRLR